MRGPGSRRRTPLGARVRVPEGLYRLLSEICELASSRSFDLPGSSRNGSIYREPREWKGCRRVHFIDGSEVSSHSGGARKQAGPTAATIPPNGGSRTENPHPRRRYSCNQPRRTLALAARGETLWTTTIAIRTRIRALRGEVTSSPRPAARDTAAANRQASDAAPAPTPRSDTDSAAPWSPCIR